MKKAEDLTFAHHPFCMPREQDLEYLYSDPKRVVAQSYDSGHEWQ